MVGGPKRGISGSRAVSRASGDPARSDLIERTDELDHLEKLVEAAGGGRGAAIAIEGTSGVGKTSLVRAAQDLARRRGVSVLAAAGDEFEQSLSFGIVRQLFEGVVRDSPAPGLLEGRCRPARPALLLDASGPAGDSWGVRHALYWLAADLATARPLLMTIDEAQWGDEESLLFLLYLIRRLPGLPVGVVTTFRTEEPSRTPAVVEALLGHPDVLRLQPAPLSTGGTAELVRRVLGSGAETDVGGCHEVTGGNPFLVVELLRALGDAGHGRDAEAVRRAAPPTVAHSVRRRLARLPTAAGDIARAAAVLGTDANPGRTALLAALTPDETRQAASALEQAGILDRSGPTLRFVHPIVGAAVYEDCDRSSASAAHVHAARILDVEGAGDRAALHLLQSDPAADPWVVERLVGAARTASPVSAVTLLTRALQEPPVGHRRAEVLVALGEAELLAGRVEARDHLRQAWEVSAGELRERAVSALARAHTLEGHVDDAVDLVVAEIGRAERVDPQRARRLGGTLAEIVVASHASMASIVDRLTGLAADPTDRAGRAAAAALLVRRYETATATPAELAELAEQALGGGAFLEDVASGSLVPVWVVYVLCRIDGYGRAQEVIEAALDTAREQGRGLHAALFAAWNGHVEARSGSLTRAQSQFEAALRLIDAPSAPLIADFVVGDLVDVLVRRGDTDTAERLLAAHEIANREPEAHLYIGRARLHLAKGRFEEAAADATAVLAVGAARGVTTPALGIRPLLARAVKATGDRARALALLDEELAAAQRLGVPSEVGAARRERAVGSGGPGSIEALRRSGRELRVTPCRLELAETLVELGSALRRANRRREARPPLTEGLELATTVGAIPLVERAERELAVTGGRAHRRPRFGAGALTPAERTVAELAISGLSNDAIAGKLFVTRKTVETQLGAAFRKLGVRRRHELAAALGE